MTELRVENGTGPESPVANDAKFRSGCFRGKYVQWFATARTYVIIFSIMQCMVSASTSYFSAILTTIEKRFKISSQTVGVIMVGNYIAQLIASGGLSYYASKGNKPRWIAVGTYTIMLYCIVSMLSHFLYGPGENALQLTKEYSGTLPSEFAEFNNSFVKIRERKFLCLPKNKSINQCEELNGHLASQILLFSSRFLLGIGNSIITTLGVSYLDDNIPKSQAPFLLSFTMLIKMVGPAVGFGISSYTLSIYISPSLHPTITQNDPRWMGAWWLGWIIFAIIFFIIGCIVILFPKSVPARKSADKSLVHNNNDHNDQSKISPSWTDLKNTLRRIITNGAFTSNTLSSIFINFCFIPYYAFMSKYIQTQYKETAAQSSFYIGLIIAIATALGLVSSAAIISKWKPRGRKLVAWNIFTSILIVIGTISYTFLGCTANDNQLSNLETTNTSLSTQLNTTNNCNCDFVTYNPVCSADGQTFISACHAGCRNLTMDSVGKKQYTDCTFRKSINTKTTDVITDAGTAVPGPCPVNCQNKLYIFLAIVFLLVFISSTTVPFRILIPLRCVDKEDKSVAIGLKLAGVSLGSMLPAPIIYGYIFDKSCLVWGKTCTGTGNCWIYDARSVSLLLNFTAAGFASLAVLSDIGLWNCIKNVKLFDEKKIDK